MTCVIFELSAKYRRAESMSGVPRNPRKKRMTVRIQCYYTVNVCISLQSCPPGRTTLHVTLNIAIVVITTRTTAECGKGNCLVSYTLGSGGEGRRRSKPRRCRRGNSPGSPWLHSRPAVNRTWGDEFKKPRFVPLRNDRICDFAQQYLATDAQRSIN
jgi:hypothetical protein